MDPISEMQLEAAEARGRDALLTEPRAADARYDRPSGRIIIELVNGCLYAFPVGLAQDLQGADAEALADIVIDGQGFNLNWPKLDVDLYVPALVAGVFGTRDWMARGFARLAGQASTPAKAAAARANGAKGGRPRKSGAV